MILFRLQELSETPSTNGEVKRAIEAGEPEGFAVRADMQTAGYGRQGRSWSSPTGGMYLSLLLRPAVDRRRLPTLSIVTALAVRCALASFVSDGNAILVKWPNDIIVQLDSPGAGGASKALSSGEAAGVCEATASLSTASAFDPACGASLEKSASSEVRPSGSAGVSGAFVDVSERKQGSVSGSYRKLAGISHELHAGALCVGIGANVRRPASTGAAQVGGKNEPAYLCELPGVARTDAREVAHAALDAFAPLYDRWQRDGVEPLLGDYERHAFLTGRAVRVEARDGNLIAEGLVRGVDAEARLLLELADGALLPVASGEAHLA